MTKLVVYIAEERSGPDFIAAETLPDAIHEMLALCTDADLRALGTVNRAGRTLQQHYAKANARKVRGERWRAWMAEENRKRAVERRRELQAAEA